LESISITESRLVTALQQFYQRRLTFALRKPGSKAS
jgi:hypothetical protein